MAEPRVIQEEIVPIVEETMRVDVRERVTGRVRVTAVNQTHAEPVAADLARKSVRIERVPVGREVDAVPAIRIENGATIFPVVEEEVVVTRRLVLREEVHVIEEQTVEHYEDTVELRRTDVTVERLPPG